MLVGSFLALAVLVAVVDDTRSLHARRPRLSAAGLTIRVRGGAVPKLPRPPKVAPEGEQMPIPKL